MLQLSGSFSTGQMVKRMLCLCIVLLGMTFPSINNAWRVQKLQKAVTIGVISATIFSNREITHAKVDSTPLDIDKLSKASYRGHVKFEIVGLKKLIRNGEYSTIHKEIEHYKPLFEPNVLQGKTEPTAATAAEVEGIRAEFASKFKELDELTTTATAIDADAEKAYSLYLSIEQAFNGIVKAYGSTAAQF